LVLSTNPVPTAVPRPPQPKIPRRKAEFAAEPLTAPGFTIIAPAAVAAAAPRNFLRLTFSFEPSAMNIPPCCFYKGDDKGCDDSGNKAPKSSKTCLKFSVLPKKSKVEG
jgi:hypothetical protein